MLVAISCLSDSTQPKLVQEVEKVACQGQVVGVSYDFSSARAKLRKEIPISIEKQR
jgi:hypothetical protein